MLVVNRPKVYMGRGIGSFSVVHYILWWEVTSLM